MAEAKDQTGNGSDPLAPEKIHIHNVKDFRYWTRALAVSSDELVSAVRAVGNDPEMVVDYLRRQRAS